MLELCRCPNIYGPDCMTFFFQTNTIGVISINIWALPGFIMAVNGCHDFEAQKMHPSSGLIKAS